MLPLIACTGARKCKTISQDAGWKLIFGLVEILLAFVATSECFPTKNPSKLTNCLITIQMPIQFRKQKTRI